MRTLFALILVTTISWSSFWLWGAHSYKADIYEWILNRQIEGLHLDIDDIALFGYPNRFDITLKNPQIYSKELNFKWHGAFLQLLRLSYNKKHTIAVFPDTHRFESGGLWFDVSSESLLASIVDLKNGKKQIIIEGTKLRIKNNVFNQAFDKAQMALLQTSADSKIQLNFLTTDETPIRKQKNLVISADLINNMDVMKHEIPLFDFSSLVLENISVSINNINVFEKDGPTKFKELLFETGIVLASG